ncbi:MAG TPA: alpha-2-macroglobulin family protein, partial [Terriglobia bacterium]|nr:alpha-2-macroglobulin family protein [Terriglobia bacterium]
EPSSVPWQPWRPASTRKLLGSATVTTDAQGGAHYQYTVPALNGITLEGTAFDSNRRQAHFDTGLWVAGTEYAQMRPSYQRPEIYLDKHSYRPGDTAHVLVVTHLPGAQVLVTTEGQQVYTWAVHASQGGSITVDVPIEEHYEPNFFIGVAFVKDEQLFEANKNVPVPAADKILNVTVQTDKPQYKPGEKVTYMISTRDPQGKPVSAEVSLGVVDEAIYAIRPDTAASPDKVFYARTWDQVQTQFSTVYWFTGYSGKQRMQLARLRAPTQLADFKNPAQLVQPQVRKYFPDTIYWMPALVTDAAGQARATFTFPDSLTTWRATVRAVTRDTIVGQVTQKVTTRKNLILRLDVPRFLTQGDTLTVTGIVHNYLDQDKAARVSLAVKGVELESPAESTVNVPRNGEATATWTVRASGIGTADFLGKALTNEESDALELAIPVRPWGLQLNAALSGSLNGDKAETAETITLPADINPDASTLRIDLAPSVAGTLMSALDYLSSYPYGCVEQTMSSFLPNILVAQAVKQLGLASPPPSIELETKIAAGLQRLYQFQHDDGGWGWWETDQTHPFMTAYVVAGLAQARAAGYSIDEDRLERGRESLVEQINENRRALPDIRAYLIYALEISVKPGLALQQALDETRKELPPAARLAIEQRHSGRTAYTGPLDSRLIDSVANSGSKLSSYGEALLALAFDRMKDPRAQDFAKRLERSVRAEGPYASWTSHREAMLDFSSDNSFEATAYALKALSNLDPRSDLLPKAARWLIDRRSDGYYWTSTEQTATAIFGLIDYLKVSGELKPSYTLDVFVNGEKLAERQVGKNDVKNPQPVTVMAKASQLHPGSNQVRITKSGPGVLYWSAFASYFKREPKPAPTGATALNIIREYYKLVPEKDDGRIVYTEQPVEGPLQPGDVIEVRLTVSATADEQYLQIEDPIPAGFEFVEQENLYELKQRPAWWDFYYTQRELHDDRAALFSTTFQRGQGQFHYLLRAVEPGTYQANPARVLPMYEPARQSSTRSMTLTVAH